MTREFGAIPANEAGWPDGVPAGNYSSSSGVLTGGVISIGAGGAGVATTFSITAGTGQIVNNTVDPTTVTAVSWTAKTNVAITNILTQLVTFVAIDSGGNVVQSSTDWTPAQQRAYVVIGVAVHSNQTTVNAVNQTQVVAYAPGSQANDLMYGLGLFNITGNVFSANGANLNINKSAGSLFRRGSNYTTLTDNPHVITTGALTQAPLRMQNQTGAGSASTTDVDVANYDLAGVTTAVSPATRFTVLRVFLFQSNLIAVQRGQAVYLSLAEAKAAIQTEAYVTNSILEANGLLRGFIVAQANATSLSDASKVFFLAAGKFGGAAGAGGLSVSTLQNAYDNSSDPEILTDSTRLALTVRRGSAADTDTIYAGMNGAGSVTFSVTGDGAISGSWVGTEIPVANGGTAGTTASAARTNLQLDRFYGSATVDQEFTSTALADVTALAGFPLAASATYWFSFECLVTTNVDTIGIKLSPNASAAVTSINCSAQYPTSATEWTSERISTLQGGTVPSSGPGATVRPYRLSGIVVTSGATTFALQARGEDASAVTVKAGSVGYIVRVG